MNDLSVVSFNTRGVNCFEKLQKIYDWLRDTNVHDALIQETNYIEKNELKYKSHWLSKIFHAFSNSPYARGVSV